jgi:hypothetical protein
MPINFGNQPAPKRQRVLTFVSPNVADILFYETVDTQRVGKSIPAYGTSHPDSTKWPNHELVYVQQDSSEGQLYRYYYAATRDSQDSYNYELRDGSELTRTYIIKRSDYPSSLTPPDGGTLDSVFTDYGFVGDTIKSVGDPLSGVYIAVQRRFVVPQTVDYVYDANLEDNVKVTKTIVPSGYDLVTEGITNSPGDTNEVRHGNNFHDILINQTIKDSQGSIADRDLETIYGSQKYEGIPQRLDSIDFDFVSAWVTGSNSNGDSIGQYSEDSTAEFPVTAPSSGPFKTKIQRTLTTNPETKVNSILASSTLLPRPKRQDISYKYAAYSTNPPVAQASARQFTLPAAIHGAITVGINGTTNGSSTAPTGLNIERNIQPTSLSATPGFNGTDLSGDYLINVSVRQTSLDLFIVESTELQLNGVYP